MPVITIEFELFCTKCGGDLTRNSAFFNANKPYCEVEVCNECMDIAFKKGYDQAMEDLRLGRWNHKLT